MTDKKIINEIDISKCEFCHSGEYCYIYSGTASFDWMCKENEDCQIKNLLLQLKAKEQECEELKSENERLQKEREKAKNYNLEYGQLLIKATNKNNKLKQTLAEIKEFAEETINSSDCYKRMYGGMCARPILQKISKCGVGK